MGAITDLVSRGIWRSEVIQVGYFNPFLLAYKIQSAYLKEELTKEQIWVRLDDMYLRRLKAEMYDREKEESMRESQQSKQFQSDHPPQTRQSNMKVGMDPRAVSHSGSPKGYSHRQTRHKQ